ncbi:SMP-30/gluconolactonase/LRE family protein [Microvirga tunisiensis]|uniref:SMP-30/gluconolactonase/LRE family protein n=1 Tax=Microvirga tunisiensis TaxID=2108360 RepID=A0A5N7MAA8_9HYPH|nr:SMP-30/gluconolactonase/LRE family protein [Microvirga tunisiensis]MPR05476.1 SMP-30/gluconolactonase/LRE family protein [Microvirga tunisiensis]MPR23677.1 SMP-30/gluconolactonase/LRE family protein [Microvirga tunisiensis]
MTDLQSQLFADGFIFLEAPRWHQGHLWVPDVFGQKLYKLDQSGAKTVVVESLPPRPNSIGFLPDGTLLIVSSVKRQILKLVDENLLTYADLSQDAAGDLNDFAIDQTGRVYIGNYGYDLFGGAPKQETCVHLVERDGAIRVAATGLEFPNGTVIINGGRTLIVAETWRGHLTAFDVASDGSLSNKRNFANLEGREPDGICADAAGGIWVPSFNTGEVLRVVEGGEVTHRIQFPGSAIACQLGGEDGRTLFCSTYAGSVPDQLAKKPYGALHAVRVDVPRPS